VPTVWEKPCNVHTYKRGCNWWSNFEVRGLKVKVIVCGRKGRPHIVSAVGAYLSFRLQRKKGAYSSSWNLPQNYGTPLVKWDHTVLSTTRQRWPPRLHPNRAGWYSIYRPRKDERLSWPSWLVTYRNGLPVHRRSPIRVLTGSDVAQLRWSKPTRYH